MSRSCWREALWALALFCSLAPSHADGNIGCLFSPSLCIEGVEWCYDDFAFGKCIPIYDSDPEEGSLYQYDMSSNQLQWFERELQQLAARGYRWEHAYTQCVLQSMLYALRHHMDPANVNSKLCDHFIDPKINSAPTGEGDEALEVEPDETAYVRFTPNSQISDSDYANEVYNPPLEPDDNPSNYVLPKADEVAIENDQIDQDEENPSDKIRDLMLMSGVEDSPVIMPFEGFRERLQENQRKQSPNEEIHVTDAFIDKEKKSLAETKSIQKLTEDNEFPDEERLGAHFRKVKFKPPPFTAEYLTANRFSPLDAEVRSNALEKYKQSFAEKNFPFEYENPGDIQEQRIYFEDDSADDFPIDAGSGELDPYHTKDLANAKAKNTKNMEYLINYWRELFGSKLNSQGGLYAEGGPLKPDDLQDVMSRSCWREALWALALFCSLAPSHADGNIGCLFSPSLCIEGVEWCYDDFAFGKCIPIYDSDPEEGSLYQYDMSSNQLQWFERELQQLAARGYRWEHAYTQCVLQSMLYALRHHMDPANVNSKLCDHFIDPKINSAPTGEGDEALEVEPDETAYVRFTPNSQISDSDYANEVYNPPLEPDDNPSNYVLPKADEVAIENDQIDQDEENPSDKIRDLMLMSGVEDSPVIMPFEGFRERLQENQRKQSPNEEIHVTDAFIDKEKKSLAETKSIQKLTEDNEFPDEERLGAHFRKVKFKPPPFTAEYLTANRFSPLDAEVRSNALEKYKQSFAEKNFPFEYENPGDIQEQRIYFEDDSADDFPIDAGSGELDPYHTKDLANAKAKNTKNMEYLINYWRELFGSKLNSQGGLYAEGGPLKPDDLQGENTEFPISDGFQDFDRDLPYRDWGFKRRERDDVKKPGPRVDAKTLKLMRNNNSVTAQDAANKLGAVKSSHDHNDYDYDPSYAFVEFHNRFLTNWEEGMAFITKLEEMLGLEKNTFTNPRVDPSEVTFKVEKNSKGYDAAEVGRQIDAIKDKVWKETGAQIKSIGIGDRTKHTVIHHIDVQEPQYFGLQLPVLLALVGSLTVLIIGAVVFAVLLKRDMSSKRKMQGLASAAEIDAEATRDYQELCRARMSGKWSGQQTPATAPHPSEQPQRITSLSREPEGNSPSTRSSTSSWSEEPALTNMDISTGHMVLAYMEDHLRNKDRLEQEWRALCAYEAEPCATTAALKQDNTTKNRYADILPYDHSRVTLNSLSNHLGSDYINASTITDHDPRNPAYIAAAGPLAHTAPDFWQMVWEQGSVVMVMLTRLTENGQQLCHRYWPEEGSELYHIYEVHLVSEHIWCDDYLVRSFYLKNQRTGETRTVTQFYFLSWPENGVPSSTKALLEFRRKVNKSYRGRSCPIVVHCSDGAGRTGTYCLIDMVLNRMAKGAKEIDIAATLEHIRDQRSRTVATKHQFEFVLMAVAEEVHAILKALPAHLQQLQEKKDKEKEKEKEKDGNDKEKPN